MTGWTLDDWRNAARNPPEGPLPDERAEDRVLAIASESLRTLCRRLWYSARANDLDTAVERADRRREAAAAEDDRRWAAGVVRAALAGEHGREIRDLAEQARDTSGHSDPDTVTAEIARRVVAAKRHDQA